jgi:hypothetical protein
VFACETQNASLQRTAKLFHARAYANVLPIVTVPCAFNTTVLCLPGNIAETTERETCTTDGEVYELVRFMRPSFISCTENRGPLACVASERRAGTVSHGASQANASRLRTNFCAAYQGGRRGKRTSAATPPSVISRSGVHAKFFTSLCSIDTVQRCAINNPHAPSMNTQTRRGGRYLRRKRTRAPHNSAQPLSRKRNTPASNENATFPAWPLRKTKESARTKKRTLYGSTKDTNSQYSNLCIIPRVCKHTRMHNSTWA